MTTSVCIALVLIGFLAGCVSLILFFRVRNQKEKHNTDTAETVEYDSCKLTF